MAYSRSGWTTVAVSKDTVETIKEKVPNVNISSFTREAIEEKLEKIDLQKERINVQRPKLAKAKKVATLKTVRAQKGDSS